MDNRYYFSQVVDGCPIFDGQEAQHMIKVRRCKIDDEIMAFNGDGNDYHLRITEIQKDKVKTQIITKKPNKATTESDIVVYLSMLKNDALVEAIDHLAELNVRTVKLFKSDYTIAVIDNKKLEKLNQTAIQASKQSERADIMQIQIIDKKDIQQDAKNSNCFFAYEDSQDKIPQFSGNFSVIIGPEGGFSESEVKYFSTFAKTISLGKTILRAPVACIASVAMLKVAQNEG